MDDWVMIPVPEELVPQVQQYKLRLDVTGAVRMWDRDLISQHLATLDDEARALVGIVAEGMGAGEPPRVSALAEQFGLSAREVLGLAQEANTVTLDPSPGTLVQVRQEQPADADEPYRVLYIWEPVAALVRAQVGAGEDRRSTP